MFNENIKNEITNPNAKANPNSIGIFTPYDRIEKGLQYDGAADERFVSGEERLNED
jgi:hypothetical protein